jgi:Ni,Fe-hydrogenase I cytochrome b subunit
MKALILAVSMIAFVVSGYFLVNDLNSLTGEMNQMIYMSLLLILMLICVVGILINVPLIVEEKRRMKSIVYKKLSKAAMKNKTPEFSF